MSLSLTGVLTGLEDTCGALVGPGGVSLGILVKCLDALRDLLVAPGAVCVHPLGCLGWLGEPGKVSALNSLASRAPLGASWDFWVCHGSSHGIH